MSIGKNAINRALNNGYSKVKTEAPDMINSTVIGATDEQVMNMVEKSVQKAPAKKPTQTKKSTSTQPKAQVKKLTPPTAKLEPEIEKLAPIKEEPAKAVKTAKKPAKKPDSSAKNKNGKSYAFGEELPVYLL